MLADDLTDAASQLDADDLRDHLEIRVVPAIVEAWVTEVSRHVADESLTDSELGELGSSSPSDVLDAYGTTLLVAAVVPGRLVVMQIGDGDIVMVTDSGDALTPVPGDARLWGNDTTSLAGRHAVEDFRINVVDFDASPRLVLLASDGYGNSYASPVGIRDVATDIAAARVDHGLAYVAEHLASWLDEPARHGSGDDTTAALIFPADP